ncbi:15354_t:CDS:2, partial [Racocetra fulgida]
DTRRVSLDLAKNIARSKNGKCLSDKYINIHTPLQWRCHQGHIWHAVLNSIKNQNSWYPQCAERFKLDINIAKEIAFKKDGKCLSEKYTNITSPLLWECNKEHQWSNTKLSIDEARKIATKNKGLCLSEIYNGPPSDIRRPDFLKTPNHLLGLELNIYYPQYGFAIEVQ